VPPDLDAVAVSDGESRPVQRTTAGRALVPVAVPAGGYQVVDLVTGPSAQPAGVHVGPGWLENSLLRVELDDRGLLCSITDKVARREVLAPGTRGNLLQLHPDYPNFYDAWDIDRFTFDQAVDIDQVESVETVESGPLRAGVRLVRRFGDSVITQVIRLEADSRLIRFDTEVEWQETNRLLKVAFPVAVRSLRATYEIQYGHVERPTHDNTSWDTARFEVCAHKWADLSEPGYGVALLNEAKYGYDISANVLRLSLLRSSTWPDPVADRGHHAFTYGLLPHPGDLREAGVIDAGYDLNVPLETVATTPHQGTAPPSASLVWVDADHVVVEVVKLAEDGSGSLIVRLYEAWGRRGPVTLTVPGPLGGAAVCDLLERELADLPVDGDSIALELAPFEIATLRLRRAGTR